jgi:F0F1-type ATP synthase membrane subunit a
MCKKMNKRKINIYLVFSSLRSSLIGGGGGGRRRMLMMMIKQQITTIRVFGTCVCVYVMFFFVWRSEQEKKNERKKQQHINLMFNHSSFESFLVIYADRVHTLFRRKHLHQHEYLDCSNRLQKYRLYLDNYE